MHALFSTEDMIALDPTTLTPLGTLVETERTQLTLAELGKTLLIKAQEGDTEQVRELMAKGAPFTTDWLGTSPLHWAAQNNHVDTVEVLLRAGISRDVRNKVERTPLHVAAQEGNIRIVNLLLQHGADVDCKDMLRMTPLHWACQNGHEDCVQLLLQYGADRHAMNKFDKTPEAIAFDINRMDIIQMLQKTPSLPQAARQMKRMTLEKSVNDPVTVTTTTTPHINTSSTQTRVTHIATTGASSVTGAPVREVRVMKIAPGRRKQYLHQSQQREIKVGSTAAPTTAILKDELWLPEQTTAATTPEIVTGTVITNQTPATDSTEKTLQLLQAHGITMLPVDDCSLVASAIQSGQTVVLTEAGKLALNLTKIPTANVVKRVSGKLPATSKLFPHRGKKVITIRADQLINMTKEKKVIIQTGDKRLKLNPPLVSSSQSDNSIEYRKTDREHEIEEKKPNFSELEAIQRKLVEAQRQAELYKEQLLQKEREAEQYKMQLESIVQGK